MGNLLILKKTASSIPNNQSVTHVLACANLDDNAIGQYCREQGIYRQDLVRWQEELMNKDTKTQEQLRQYRDENKSLKAEKKQLERELKRKEKALAEAAAIIVLKKKVASYFEEDADS